MAISELKIGKTYRDEDGNTYEILRGPSVNQNLVVMYDTQNDEASVVDRQAPILNPQYYREFTEVPEYEGWPIDIKVEIMLTKESQWDQPGVKRARFAGIDHRGKPMAFKPWGSDEWSSMGQKESVPHIRLAV